MGTFGRGTKVGPTGLIGPGGNVIGGGPGGPGGSEEERERSTWLAEDRDIWGADAEEWAPSVIGELKPTRRNEERQIRSEHVDQRPETDSEKPRMSEEPVEKDDLDELLDELEAELDLEIVDLDEEVRSADEVEDAALDDDLDDLLDGLVHDHTGSGDDPKAAQ
ncbi:hypothetical protein [Actinomadura vinacea]